ncbi:MFS transporter [Saccharothrix coeruleofusca]|uniref:MFS transporter n=1 Tax=Saccharothrix coeruleofusca TaxID=33919 RepID=UPI00166F818A|nr:MFS transporter [Saccharothrix coeruleofusca]
MGTNALLQEDRRALRLFVALVGGYSVSAYGTYLNLVALSLFTWHLTGSAFTTGVIMALRLTCGFLGGLVAGRIAVAGRTAMIGSDIAQAAAMVALVIWPSLAVLCAVAVVMGVGNTFFAVALRSSVPRMVGQHQRTKANGYLVTGRSIGTVLGFVSAGVLIPAAGYDAAFLVNAASFVVCAATLAALPLGTTTPEPSRPSAPIGTLKLLRTLPACFLGMFAVRGADALGSASHNVALPIFTPAPAFMSQFWTAWAIGAFSAHHVVSRWVERRGSPPGERAFAIGTCVMSLAFFTAFTGLPAVGLVVVVFAAGLADGLTEISYVSRLQTLPEELRGRAFGVSASVEAGGFAIGMLIAAGLLEALPPPAVVGLLHGAALVTAGTLLLISTTLRRT